jgi:hypothetical protein
MRHQAVILSVRHELALDSRSSSGNAGGNNNLQRWKTKPNAIVTFRCVHPGFAPRMGEFAFVGMSAATSDRGVSSLTEVGA